ncbi:hypothetical protein LTR56_025707 [Elasticomyces elasticus]|nr:hypothetical protein LTR56_025707 [Elasticomyces elasticus]KAK3642365.1 hypothetical protein LTR22_016180 [Elasticomyces elasticus]KAK4914441.1 hypothetical protein LTR49_017361 [Elasticomyces elasticus]KAK5760416.1 hypothetical protein LTS12_009460 [Elasticomyces elasticus]
MSTGESTPTEQSTLPADAVPWPQPNGLYGQYALHCHCGAVRWNMKLSPPLLAEETTTDHPERYTANECLCSYCVRNGHWATNPFVKDVEWTQGLEHRVLYWTAGKQNPFWICGKCHCLLGMDLSAIMEQFGMPEDQKRCTVNVRMLKDFDPAKLQVRQMTMARDMGDPYTVEE